MEGDSLKISVIVPVYNCGYFLLRFICSILNQTHTNIELILINDGSTDNSGDICDSFAKKDLRVKVVHQKNSGVSVARNRGLELAVGDYITFVDSDDYIESQMYERLIDILTRYDADIAHCGYKRVDTEGNVQKEVNGTHKIICQNQIEATNSFLQGQYFNCGIWNKLFKKALFSDIRFDTRLRINEDVVVGFLAFQKSNKIVFVDETYYCYVVHSDSACNTINEKKKILDEIEATRIMLQRSVYEDNKKVLGYRLFDKNLRLYRWHIFNKEISDNAERRQLRIELKVLKRANKKLNLRSRINYYFLVYFSPLYKMIYAKYDQVRIPNWDPKI